MSNPDESSLLKPRPAVDKHQQRIINSLVERLAEVARVEPATVIQKNRLGENSLEEAVPYLERTRRLAVLLHDCSLEELPTPILGEILGPVESMSNSITSLMEFSPGRGVTHDQTIDRIRTAWEAFHEKSAPALAVANMLSDRESAHARDKLAAIERAVERSAEALGVSQKAAADAQAILDGIRAAAGEVAVTTQAAEFERVARDYRGSARRWLISLIVLTGIAFFYALVILPDEISSISVDPPDPRIWHHLLNKALIVSLLFFVIGWVARNYSASRHNFVANQHRQSALTVYRALVEGVRDDPQARNAILVAGSHAIFSPASTGYTKGESTDQPQPWMIEVVRAATKSGGTTPPQP